MRGGTACVESESSSSYSRRLVESHHHQSSFRSGRASARPRMTAPVRPLSPPMKNGMAPPAKTSRAVDAAVVCNLDRGVWSSSRRDRGTRGGKLDTAANVVSDAGFAERLRSTCAGRVGMDSKGSPSGQSRRAEQARDSSVEAAVGDHGGWRRFTPESAVSREIVIGQRCSSRVSPCSSRGKQLGFARSSEEGRR